VGNIDWPSRTGLSVDDQQAELRALLDHARLLNLNAVILQVRPACDALYASAIEPWSEYLTGTQGKAPEPFYDPLAFAVDEAHRRGLELHAWFNPYRARSAASKAPLAPGHIARARPALVKAYGKQLWLDPGDPAVQDHTTTVILDVVRRYDIDGVHLDDYFYPYAENDAKGKAIPFPDDASFQIYRAGGGSLPRPDWRRGNVNTLVARLYKEIKAVKPWVKFGISPFGIWRPGSPPQIKGLDAYATLYADSRKWLQEGWCDYLAPQLYWKIEQPGQSFAVLLIWWTMQNAKGRHLWPGLFTSKHDRIEIEYQTRVTRGVEGAGGNIHFSSAALTAGERGDHLKATVYDQPALVPASPWLNDTPPEMPRELAPTADGRIRWRASETGAPFLWAVQWRRGAEWSAQLLPAVSIATDGTFVTCPLPPLGPPADAVAVQAIDRLGNGSASAILSLKGNA
jgi:uncharacterized lipoprotein YddW (UPF0748 family)